MSGFLLSSYQVHSNAQRQPTLNCRQIGARALRTRRVARNQPLRLRHRAYRRVALREKHDLKSAGREIGRAGPAPGTKALQPEQKFLHAVAKEHCTFDYISGQTVAEIAGAVARCGAPIGLRGQVHQVEIRQRYETAGTRRHVSVRIDDERVSQRVSA